MTFKNGYRVWDNDETQAGNTLAEKICEIIDAKHNGVISHDEAMIRYLVLEPDLAQIMLDDAINDGNMNEVYLYKGALRKPRIGHVRSLLALLTDRNLPTTLKKPLGLAITSKRLSIYFKPPFQQVHN